MSSGYRIFFVKPQQNSRPYGMMPPMGVMYLASYARKLMDDVEVRIVDMTVEKVTYRRLAEMLRSFTPNVVGISALSFESVGLHRVAAIAKQLPSKPTVMVGGPHPSAYPLKVMSDANIDYTVIGEGELTFGDLLQALRRGGPVGHIDGLVYRENGGVRVNPRERYVEDMDSLPYPAWDLIAYRKYKHIIRMSHTGTKDYMPISTSRSCPFRCIYCHGLFGRGFRARSPENVIEEFRQLYEDYGIRQFEIIDDIFNWDIDRAKRICDLIIQSGMKIRMTFPNGVRGDRLDEELILKLREAGTIFLAFAVETASPRLQKLIRKHINLDKIQENIAIARKTGMVIQAVFMLGFPSETREELHATVDFAVNNPNLHTIQLFMVNPFEGTELAELAVKYGKASHSQFENAYLSSGFTNLTDLSDEELDSIRRRGLRRFWLTPSRIWSVVRDYPDKEKLPEIALTFVKRLAVRA